MKTTPLSLGSCICTFGFQTENLISLAPSVSLSGETQFKQKYTQVALVVKNPPANVRDVGNSGSIPESGRSPGRGHGKPLQSSCLENPMGREPGGLQSMGSRRVGRNCVTSLSLSTFRHWRRKWQPTPVFLPGESQGRRSRVGCRLWGRAQLMWLRSSSSKVGENQLSHQKGRPERRGARREGPRVHHRGLHHFPSTEVCTAFHPPGISSLSNSFQVVSCLTRVPITSLPALFT